MNFQQAQYNMIEQQIRPWNVLAQTTLDSLYQICRADFVLEQHRDLAFSDCELPIGHGQTMLPPRVEAKFLQDIELKPTDLVLEIGSGSGYMAALLATQAAEVLSFEIIPDLAAFATSNIAKAQVKNVKIVNADALNYSLVGKKFDAIVVSGAVNRNIIKNLSKYLSHGGRLIGVIGEAPVMQAILLTNANASHDFSYEILFETVVAKLNYSSCVGGEQFVL